MSDFIITPRGNLVNKTAGASPVLAGNTVTFGDVVETFGDAMLAEGYYNSLLYQLVNTADGANLALDLRPAGPILLQVLPSPVTVQAGTLVVIRGTGFTAAAGELHFEDTPGGLDDNGFYLNCTFVNSTTMTAVYGGPGDGALTPTMLVYYRDSNNLASNVLNATDDGVNPVFTMIQGNPPSSPMTVTGYQSPVGGSDGNPANANINGSSVTLMGSGFAAGQNGRLVSVDGTINAALTVNAANNATVTLPAVPAGTVVFNLAYKASNGQQQTLSPAVAITFS